MRAEVGKDRSFPVLESRNDEPFRAFIRGQHLTGRTGAQRFGQWQALWFGAPQEARFCRKFGLQVVIAQQFGKFVAQVAHR